MSRDLLCLPFVDHREACADARSEEENQQKTILAWSHHWHLPSLHLHISLKVLWVARVSVCFCRVGLWSLAREWVREPRGNDDQTDSDESQLWVRGRGRSICQVVLHKSSFDLKIGAEYLPKPLNKLNVLLGDWWLYDDCESETCCCLAPLSHLNCTSTLVREGVNFPCYGQYDTSYYD